MGARKNATDRRRGTLDLLVLKTLASRGPMHGYAITLHVQQISKDVLRIEEGSLYPALHRMTQAGWLRAEWGNSENNRTHVITPSLLQAAGSSFRKRRIGVVSRARSLRFSSLHRHLDAGPHTSA